MNPRPPTAAEYALAKLIFDWLYHKGTCESCEQFPDCPSPDPNVTCPEGDRAIKAIHAFLNTHTTRKTQP